MSKGKRILSVIGGFLFACGFASAAYAASATITATVTDSKVEVVSEGSFTSDSHWTPVDSGPLAPGYYITHNGGCLRTTVGSKCTEGSSVSLTGTLERATQSPGKHTLSASATDAHETVTTTVDYHIDNTPTPKVSAPTGGLHGGSAPIGGEVKFVPRLDPTAYHGYVSFQYRRTDYNDNWHQLFRKNSYSAVYDVSQLGEWPTHSMPNGSYEARVTASSANGQWAESGTTSFSVDNSPSAKLEAPTGTVRGGPVSFAGTVTFAQMPDPNGYHGYLNIQYRSAGGYWRSAGKYYSYSAVYDLSKHELATQFMSDGQYEAKVTARAFNGAEADSNIITFSVNNSPEIKLEAPAGSLRGGPVKLGGMVSFIPMPDPTVYHGKVNAYYRLAGSYWRLIGKYYSYSPSFNLSQAEIATHLLSTGAYEVKVVATAANGKVSESPIIEFSLDNDPIISLSGPVGTLRGGPSPWVGHVGFVEQADPTSNHVQISAYYRPVGSYWRLIDRKYSYSPGLILQTFPGCQPKYSLTASTRQR